MDEWTDDWIDGWMVDQWMYELIDGCMGGWIDGWKNECMYGCMDGWLDGYIYIYIYIYIDGWMDGCMDIWMYGCMDSWMDRYIDVWMYGCMDGWKFNIFADDIIIYLIIPLKNNDNSSLINCTNNIRNWLINNNLLLNIDKTQLINISKNFTQNKFPIYLIDNLIVEPSKNLKCLGVIIDEHML